MRLTEAQLRKYIDYIRLELKALEQLAKNLEKYGYRQDAQAAEKIRKRAEAIEQQLANLEREI